MRTNVKMLLLGCLLLSGVQAWHEQAPSPIVFLRANALIQLDENYTLVKVTPHVEEPQNYSTYLNLSNLRLKAIDAEAFSDFFSRSIKTVDLTHNSLHDIPRRAWKDLPELEILDLSDNNISSGHFYADSTPSLKFLNISNNLPTAFGPGYFYGLKDTYIFTHGVDIEYISTLAFENYLPDFQGYVMENTNISANRHRRAISDSSRVGSLRAVVCIKNGKLMSVSPPKRRSPVISFECRDILIKNQILDLVERKISDFDIGWYKLKNYTIKSIDLRGNKITAIRNSILDGLPDDVNLHLGVNFVKHITVSNEYRIHNLHLKFNNITEISNGALANLNLHGLNLAGNQLENTQFLDTLPSGLSFVSVKDNKITEISAGNFSKCTNFSHLDLSHNLIMYAKKNTLRGFTSLRRLYLSYNGLKQIARYFFEDLKNLEWLGLENNDLSSLDEDVFSGLENIKVINLTMNHLTEIGPGPFSRLPNSFKKLYLSCNDITIVKKGSFVNVPTGELSLSHNKISTIERGSFEIPQLEFLHLGFNRLNEIDGAAFRGFRTLDILSLESNNIREIDNGLDIRLNSLYTLNLSNNPFRVLRNGSLSGLSKDYNTKVILKGVPIESIHSKLFDEE